MTIANAIYRGLSDSLSAAIDTGNIEEVSAVLEDAESSWAAGQVGMDQLEDLYTDARVAGYDL